ncbi:MAG: hypothetical protein LBJ36_04555 [Synergistaceae bacterium]|nr:hypothetical protein [Synergistaceae bacterium]
MYLGKGFLFAVGLTLSFASSSFAATQRLGAVAGSNAKTQSFNESAANMGAGRGTGPGVDLTKIASSKKPQTFTGLPDGTLPGGGAVRPDRSYNPTGKIVFSGDPVDPVIGPEMLGSTLDRVYSIADHVGYGMVKKNYVPGALDAIYVFDVMAGRARRYVLYFDRSAKLLKIEFFEPVDKKWITF